MDAHPGYGCSRKESLPYLDDIGGGRFGQSMAIHAEFGRRYARKLATLDIVVAIAAIDAYVACVNLVAIVDRLRRLISHVKMFWRKPIPENEDHGAKSSESRYDQDGRYLVGPLWEYH